ncbi:MAG: FtsX-like permease family protein, partial [Clostridium sp.]|nr:FtsX-like permease family protein [Clostridium sp.]
MKNRIVTTSIREIKTSFKRFLSLIIISFLGVAVFVGINSAPINMIESLDNYLDEKDAYDIKITSNKGITDKSISEIKYEDIDNIEGSKTLDFEVDAKETSYVVRVHSYNKQSVNKLKLIDGNLPKADDEIVVEDMLLKKENLNIGDYITLKDEKSILNNKKLKIVGTVESALYFSYQENNQKISSTNIGTGIVKYFIYTPEDNIKINFYTEAYITVKDAKNLLTDSEEYNEKIDKVKDELSSDGFIVTDRRDDSTYSNFIDSCNSIRDLSKLFPVVFFIISIFISLVTMSRMAEANRGEIGALKSLGFSNSHILFKYILYASVATITGGIIGAVVGLITIPSIIWNIYKILFTIPNYVVKVEYIYIIEGILISFVCICGTTIITVIKNTRINTAELLRPKAPKNGKRVWLEYITFIWKRISFSHKVTIRNMFRYKVRAFMTIIGVAGCTALLLSGFGLRGSVKNIPNYQYREVFQYNDMVYINPSMLKEPIKDVFADKDIKKYLLNYSRNINMNKDGIKSDMNLMVPDNIDNFSEIFKLKDIKTNEELDLKDNEAIVTSKFADIYNLKVGDSFTFTDDDGKEYTMVIGGICKHYVNHYVFINKATWEKMSGNYIYNTAFLKTSALSSEENQELASKLLEHDGILQVDIMDTITENIENMLNSLNSVVIILILFSAALSFVVMYNLSNINIVERKREIATLKVLGFYNSEVDNYIIKENIILTLIGIILGLFGGYYFTEVLISTVEMERLRFIYDISWQSYLVSGV